MKTLYAMVLSLALAVPTTLFGEDWHPITPPNAPEARYGHSMVKLPDGSVLLFGGEDADEAISNDLHNFDGNSWDLLEPNKNPPPARRDHEAWVQGRQMYVTGGYGIDKVLDDTWRYDIDDNEWHEVTHSGPKPSARYGHSVTPVGDGSALISGGTGEDGYELQDLWKRNTDGSYTKLPSSSIAYSHHVAQLINDDVLFIFGEPGTISIYHISEQSWGIISGGPALSGHATSTTAENAQGEPVILVFGGKDADGQESDAVYQYNAATGELTQRESIPYPNSGSAAAVLGPPEDTASPASLNSTSENLAFLNGDNNPATVAELQMLFFGGKTDEGLTSNTLWYSQLRFTDISVSGETNVALSWQSVPGEHYTLERSKNSVSNAWETVATGIVAAPLVNTYTTATEEAACTFYRLVEE